MWSILFGFSNKVFQKIKRETANDVREMVLKEVYNQAQALSTESKEQKAATTSLKTEVEKIKNQLEMEKEVNLKNRKENEQQKVELTKLKEEVEQ